MLATLPLKSLTELGFTIAFGVLLDTFIVRSLLVPALVFDIGKPVWWPSALARTDRGGGGGGGRGGSGSGDDSDDGSSNGTRVGIPAAAGGGPSPRPIRVELGGLTLASSDGALRVLETSHPPTIYIPPADVRLDVLEPSDAGSTWCEYKGVARYLDAVIDGRRYEAIGWSYARAVTRLRDAAGLRRVLPWPRRRRLDRRRARRRPAGRLLRRLDHL